MLENSAFLNRAKWMLEYWSMDVDPAALATALVLFALVVVLRKPLAKAASQLLARLFETLSIELSESVRVTMEEALRVIIVTGAALFASDALSLPAIFNGVLQKLLLSVLVLAVFTGLYRLLEPLIAVLDPEKLTSVEVDTSWIVRIGQFTVIILATTAVLAVWNIDISSALTGVGVFGAGLAIAAQDFIRNLFAGMNNMSEKRFAPGDWIAIEGGVEGTVERVDVRSTTIMDFDRTPRYVPNSDLSNAVVLNKSRMDHRKIYWTIPLVLDATDDQIQAICDAILSYLKECGDFMLEDSMPLFALPTGLSEHAIEITIYAFTRTRDYQPYLELSGRLLLAVRQAVADAGTELAYPTQTVTFGSNKGRDLRDMAVD